MVKKVRESTKHLACDFYLNRICFFRKTNKLRIVSTSLYTVFVVSILYNSVINNPEIQISNCITSVIIQNSVNTKTKILLREPLVLSRFFMCLYVTHVLIWTRHTACRKFLFANYEYIHIYEIQRFELATNDHVVPHDNQK